MTYVVPGHSRKYYRIDDAERDIEEYRRLSADCERQSFDVLWVRHRNRLGRTLALITTVEAIVREVGGGQVYSAFMPHDIKAHTGSQASLMGAVEGWQSEADNRERALKFKMGMRGRVLRRGLMGTVIPMGYARIKDDKGKTVGYEPDEFAASVAAATRLYLDGLTYSEAARRLNGNGYRLPSGQPWHYYDVARIVGNDAYAGRPRLGPLQWEGEPQYPPLWDDATWLAVQRERTRRQTAPRLSRGGNPYSGVLFCARCGGIMAQFSAPRGERVYAYYRCQNHSRALNPAETCHGNCIARWKVTAALVDYFYSLQTPERIDQLLAKYGDSADADRLRGEIEQAERAAKDTAAARHQAGLTHSRGKMHEDVYWQVDDVLLSELEGHTGRAAELARQLASLPDLEEWRAQLSDVAEEFAGAADGFAPAETVAAALQRASIKVFISDGEVIAIEP